MPIHRCELCRFTTDKYILFIETRKERWKTGKFWKKRKEIFKGLTKFFWWVIFA